MSIPGLMGFLFDVIPDGLGLSMGLRGVQSEKSIMGLTFGPHGPIDCGSSNWWAKGQERLSLLHHGNN